ncbi:MAG: penicillin acylase family protein [Bacteroidota bacterium]
MRIAKFIIALILTLGLVLALNRPIALSETTVPPVGKFFNPFGGFWQNADRTDPAVGASMALQLPSLTGEASVQFDDRMVPHLFAENTKDLFLLQGYVTARDRLFQMDLSTRAAAGRLSELLGERTLGYDQLQRRRGMAFGAQNTLDTWKKEPQYFEFVQQYTAGVNAYINQLSYADYPIEYKLLDHFPEPWTELKSALLIKSMAQTLCSRELDLESTNALQLLGQEQFDFLYPEYNPAERPVISEEVVWDFEGPGASSATPASSSDPIGLIHHRSHPKTPEGIGSNNWAVAGSKTASGLAILCNDPHLRLTLPSIWYEAQLHTPEFNVYGVSLPGFPGIVIGFNNNIAWGMTNTSQDVLDWYQIEWTDEQKTHYLLDGQAEKADMVYEEYQVKGGATVYDTVRYTKWGPVVYEGDDDDHKDMAMRWLAHDAGGNELKVFYGLGTARNHEDYTKAISNFWTPAQNIVFAATNGDVALRVQGRFPLKKDQQGRFVQDGSQSANAWQGLIPAEHGAADYNPQRGFVSSANQRSTTEEYPYYYNGTFADYRGRLLIRRLEEMQQIKVEDMIALQNDVYSLKAEEALPLLLQTLDASALNQEQQAFLAELKSWDYRYTANAVAPILFDRWLIRFYRATWDEMKSDTLDILSPETWRTIALLGEDPENKYFDDLATPKQETAQDIVTRSFQEMSEDVEEWKKKGKELIWKNFQSPQITHLLRLPAFGSGQLDVGGSRQSLNAISERNGPSWRMVVEMGSPIKAYGIYPGGQSGNPGSPYYDNMIKDWSEGKPYPLLFLQSPAEDNSAILFTQTFTKS